MPHFNVEFPHSEERHGMNHKCRQSGCYKEKDICDFTLHNDWYGGVPSVTDIDYVVEKNGNFLIQEWKKPGNEITTGQQILFKHWAGTNRAVRYAKFTVMQVEGYAGRLEVVRFRFYNWQVSFKEVRRDNTDIWGKWLSHELYEKACKKWYERAKSNWFFHNRHIRK